MTQPTVMYFGPDRARRNDDEPSLKIYLRTLLYATSKRGRIIESLFVRVRRGETTQNFNIWVYGDGSLNRGSGLYVGEDGVTANHHFLLPADGTPFNFVPGTYTIQVFAVVVGDDKTRLLRSMIVDVTTEHYAALSTPHHGLYFDWSPDAKTYHAHVRAYTPDFTIGLT